MTPASAVHGPLLDALDAALGPWPDSAAQSARCDEREEFPAWLCARLDEFGLHRYYVPECLGGLFEDHELMLRLWRTVARRDLSATVAHGKTYLGVAPVRIAGSTSQQAAVGRAVLSGAPVGCALSEPDHGADLLNGSTTATAVPGGYRLDGVKWPINNGTRATHLTVLARSTDGTRPAPGDGAARARALDFFLVPKEELPQGSWRQLPKVRTHGVRGIDLSGVEFLGALLGPDARVGAPGTGLETALKALQLTRTVCSAMSLGAGEQALRLAGRTLTTSAGPPSALADLLTDCVGLLAAAEATSLVGTRSAHCLTSELSVTSAVVKAAAPALIGELLDEIAELLGPTAALTGGPRGAFQQVARDHQVVAVFDGSTPVNRASLIQQFPRLARRLATGAYDADGLAEAVAVGTRPRPLDRSLLSLASRSGCSVVQSLPELVGTISGPPGLTAYAAALRAAVLRLGGALAEVRPAARPPMAAHELAAAYELAFAGAACLWLWTTRADHHTGEALWQDGRWVRAALRSVTLRLCRLLRTAPPDPAPGDIQLERELPLLLISAAHDGAPVSPFGTALPGTAETG